ncbi:MAG: PTS fructose transporter subunit IIA [Methylophilales bacterium RIFCSPHIGHO2_02_FULL_57_10]|nr:MAG: PTS fructose transporter subunit IIA [Methylophilales bacterium RIFCSPHIGHO2_02_FULL_57_10]
MAHGTLGESLIHCASHVLGSRPPLLKQLGVSVHDDPVEVLPNARELVRELNQEGGGVLILSDIYGATPCNIVSQLLEPGRVEGIAGVNLPMLVRAIAYRNENLETLVEKAITGGAGGILHITQEMCKT